ncbi:uncharacterized protein TrAtP1_013361 [Trichoderma atroviride]|nr:hypothetical protein TrAtP1_013361 [Trichoderma atroviride]
MRKTPIVSHFVLTFLYQFIRHSPKDKQKAIFKRFLRDLVQVIHGGEKDYITESERFKASTDMWLNKVIGAPAGILWAALMTVLTNEPDRQLLVIVDGLENIEDDTGEFIKGIRTFVDRLRQRNLNMKALLASQPRDHIKEIFGGLPYIEHDEMRESQATLCFNNPSHSKISKEHESSVEWE